MPDNRAADRLQRTRTDAHTRTGCRHSCPTSGDARHGDSHARAAYTRRPRNDDFGANRDSIGPPHLDLHANTNARTTHCHANARAAYCHANAATHATATPVSTTATPTLVPPTVTSTSVPPTATPTPTQIPGRAELYEMIQPPMAPAYIDWRWEHGQDNFRELVTDFTIHNDVGDWSDEHGYYLILIQNQISGVGFYFGLQTDVSAPFYPYRGGKGVIFSRWETRDLSNARWDQSDGWTQSSGHEGDFIGVRRSYDWDTGDYRIRIAPDGLDSDGEWFGLWITDLAADEETWIGSLKFPMLNGTATFVPHSSATIEIYGNLRIRPIDIPQWHVSVRRPLGDGVPATWGETSYPYDDSDNALPSSDVRYDPLEDAAHLRVGGTTERITAPGRIDFE